MYKQFVLVGASILMLVGNGYAEWIGGTRGWNYSNADTNFYPWSTACKVGIGTMNPGAKLHVSGGYIRYQNTDPAIIIQDMDGNGDSQTGYITFRDSSDTQVGWIGFGSGGNDDFTILNAHSGGHIILNPSGNVGIGTTSPSSKLDVRDGNIEIDNGESATIASSAHNLFFDGMGYAHRTYHFRPGASTSGYTNASVSIYYADATPTYYERIRLHSNGNSFFTGGNVGIGTSSPGYKLDVAGDINTTGDVRKNGTAYNNPDYVFEPGYKLLSLDSLKEFVIEKRHLPNMPSSEEIKKEGIKIFEQNRLILEKLEEAYLYIFAQQKEIEELKLILKQ